MRDNPVVRGGTPVDLGTTAAKLGATPADVRPMLANLTRRVARLGDEALLRDLARLITQDRMTTAEILAHIAEVDSRRLYAPAGYPSMHAYCVGELRLSEDAASKRIQAARAARRVPALLEALADGRLHLSAARLLAPYITGENAEELIEAATHRTKAEVEAMLVRRFSPSWALRLDSRQVEDDNLEVAEHAPGHVGDDGAKLVGSSGLSTGGVSLAVAQHAPGHVEGLVVPVVTPFPERASLHVTISRTTQEKLRYAQTLLSHAVPSGDPAQVLDRALDALIVQMERRRFGAGAPRAHGPRATVPAEPLRTPAVRRQTPALERQTTAAQHQTPVAECPARKRYIPARIRRAVWERDGGRCTFVGTGGHRCESRRFLEFDHVDPVARGGVATVAGVRLRCRTHNQHEADRVFGAGFMSERRQRARAERDMTRAERNGAQSRAEGHARSQARAGSRARVRLDEDALDIQACLRRLGCRADEARRAAERAVAMLPAATLEERLRAALQSLGGRAVTIPPPTALSTTHTSAGSRGSAPGG